MIRRRVTSHHHHHEKPGNRKWIDYAAWVVTKIIWFLIGFVVSLFLLVRQSIRPAPLIEFGPLLLVAATAAGALAALFGPTIFQEETERGRGNLEEIRRQSKGLPDRINDKH